MLAFSYLGGGGEKLGRKKVRRKKIRKIRKIEEFKVIR